MGPQPASVSGNSREERKNEMLVYTIEPDDESNRRKNACPGCPGSGDGEWCARCRRYEIAGRDGE